MSRKQEPPHSRKRNVPPAPSTGQGAASALDAMIKRRVTAPGGEKPPGLAPKKH
jgi:hypothetical protein